MTNKNKKLTMDPDTLAAFVDGELTPEDAALVMMHLDAHPEDQAFVDGIEASNKLLGKAYDAPLYEPVPEAILSTIRDFETSEAEDFGPESNVIPFNFARPSGRVQAIGGLLAASLAVAVGLGLWGGQQQDRLAVGTLSTASVLSGVLNSVPTGGIAELTDIDAEVTVLSSFIDDQRRPCREVEVVSDTGLERGIACRADAQWTIAGRVTLPEIDPQGEGVFVPAEGASASDLDEVLDRLGAGMILSHEEEADLIARDWKN